jgi:putative protease
MVEGECIGAVSHYYKKVQVGVIQLHADLILGEELHFKGAYTDFMQKVDSMQVNHAAVEQAPAHSEVAIRVDQRVRHGDSVYRVTP